MQIMQNPYTDQGPSCEQFKNKRLIGLLTNQVTLVYRVVLILMAIIKPDYKGNTIVNLIHSSEKLDFQTDQRGMGLKF